MDNTYFEKGIVEHGVSLGNGTVYPFRLTKLGYKYGICLFSVLMVVNSRTPFTLECYQNVDPCELPKRSMRELSRGGTFINKRGYEWVLSYIESHQFNDYLYNLACYTPEEPEKRLQIFGLD